MYNIYTLRMNCRSFFLQYRAAGIETTLHLVEHDAVLCTALNRPVTSHHSSQVSGTSTEERMGRQ